MSEFDRGPSAQLTKLFDRVPDPPVKEHTWFDWGPMFYRGRLDGSARVLCIASDPGPTERIAGRCLVGDAGQRVQGLLSKLGLTKSYVCLNAWAYAVKPGKAPRDVRAALDEPAQLEWRNELYEAATGPDLQAIIAFGYMAQDAVKLWSGRPSVEVFDVPHPSSHEPKKLLDGWREAVEDLRGIVTPDSDGDSTGPNYGTKFAETDYAAIPRRDLPFGAPAFLGDDVWVRAKPGAARNSVERDGPHKLVWDAPDLPG